MILGLTGKIGAGKNTVAQRLATLTTTPIVEVSYAAQLKQSAAAALGVTVKQLEAWKNNPAARVTVSAPGGEFHQSTVREVLQRYGTEAHRDIFGGDFWLDAALPILDHFYDDALYVVTDVRFENEAARVRQLGGKVVLVVGPNNETGDHPSERLVAVDYTVNNLVRDDGYASLDASLNVLLAELEEERASAFAAAIAEPIPAPA